MRLPTCHPWKSLEIEATDAGWRDLRHLARACKVPARVTERLFCGMSINEDDRLQLRRLARAGPTSGPVWIRTPHDAAPDPDPGPKTVKTTETTETTTVRETEDGRWVLNIPA